MFSRAVLAFLGLPGFFAGIVPWVVASLDPWRQSGWAIGGIILGFGFLAAAFHLRVVFHEEPLLSK